MVSRLLKLQPQVELLISANNDDEFPDVNWELLKKSEKILLQFHLRIQMLQANNANVVLLSRVWEEIFDMILNSLEKDKNKIKNEGKFTKKIMSHHAKITTSGVYHLSLLLWPSNAHTESMRKKGFEELENLIDKQ